MKRVWGAEKPYFELVRRPLGRAQRAGAAAARSGLDARSLAAPVRLVGAGRHRAQRTRAGNTSGRSTMSASCRAARARNSPVPLLRRLAALGVPMLVVRRVRPVSLAGRRLRPRSSAASTTAVLACAKAAGLGDARPVRRRSTMAVSPQGFARCYRSLASRARRHRARRPADRRRAGSVTSRPGSLYMPPAVVRAPRA